VTALEWRARPSAERVVVRSSRLRGSLPRDSPPTSDLFDDGADDDVIDPATGMPDMSQRSRSGARASPPGVGILGGLGVAGGAGIAESLVRQGMQGGIDPLQVGIDGMLSAATFGIARHTLGSFVQRLGGSQAGPVSIQAGSRLPAPRALDELRALARALDGGRRMCTCTSVRVTEKPVYTGITNSLARRQTQHGDRFALQQLTSDPLTRGQALRVGSSRR
jgi:hypothetical protein